MAGDYRCHICDKSMSTKYNLQRHINKNHKNLDGAIVQNSSEPEVKPEIVAGWQIN